MKLASVICLICVVLYSKTNGVEAEPVIKERPSDSSDQSTLELLHVVGVEPQTSEKSLNI